MADIKEPYDECKAHPRMAITAEFHNKCVTTIRNDIASQVGDVQKALDEYIQTPVDAETFDGQTSEEWKEELDGRYAHIDHDHDSVRRYRRYFMELEVIIPDPDDDTKRILQPAVIAHGMGRHPVVQVYRLTDLDIQYPARSTGHHRFCFCGPAHHSDPEAAEFKTRSFDERHWGDRIDDKMIQDLARELAPAEQKKFQAQFKEDFTLNVWLSNLEKALFEPGPGQYHFDSGDVYRTRWVLDRQMTPVKELIQRGEWPARFVYRAHLVNNIAWEIGTTEDPSGEPARTPIPIDIYHLNLNEIEISPQTDEEIHLMVLLRS